MSNLASYSSHLNTACLLFLRHLQVLCMGLSPDRMAQEQLTSGAVALQELITLRERQYLEQPNTLASAQRSLNTLPPNQRTMAPPTGKVGYVKKKGGREGQGETASGWAVRRQRNPLSAASGWETVTVTGWGPRVCFAPLSNTGWELSHSQIQS